MMGIGAFAGAVDLGGSGGDGSPPTVFPWIGTDDAVDLGEQTITLPTTPSDSSTIEFTIRGVRYYYPDDFTRSGRVLHWLGGGEGARETFFIEANDYGEIRYLV